MIRTALTLSLVLVLFGAAVADEREVARDDGVKTGMKSSAGTGHVIALDAPKGEWWVTAVRVFGARYGGGYDPAATTFTVAITDERLTPLGTTTAMYDRFAPGKFDWVEIPLAEPVKVAGTFQVVVAFDPSATRGVYVAHCATKESRSGYGLAGGRESAFAADKEWMIRAVLTDQGETEGDADRVELAHDDGTAKDYRSLGGSGHVVEFRKPSGTWWIESVRIHGSRYGGGYEPAATPFTVAIASPSMRPIREERAPYALFPAGDFGWVTVPLTEPVRAPSRFRVAVDFAPTRTKGVYLAFSEGDAKESYTGRVGGRVSRFDDGPWMIRVVLVEEKPAPREPLLAAPKGPDAYRADTEFVLTTIREHFPALEKKGVDPDALAKEFLPAAATAADDAAHVRNMMRLLARLGDSHTGIMRTKTAARSPAFDGLYGAGMWIATEGDRILLRALMSGHALTGKLVPGADLALVGGRPAAEVLAETRARLREWSGWSSTHFLDARLSFQFFPFGDRTELPAVFVNPDGNRVEFRLERWGPGGRGLSRIDVTMPDGVEAAPRAVAKKLTEKIGYLRITGGMDEATEKDFFAAFDSLKGVNGILLDGRGMGGGSDRPAWNMAGRFYEKGVAHGPVTLGPTGDWQFEGPVVYLTDERMVSSAETFTWAMTETGRAVQVGRPTGGATIIPRMFDAPSGLFSFRMGVTDRKTPGKGVQPEGIGTAPDVFVPYSARNLAGGRDPELDAGRMLLDLLIGGTPREKAIAAVRDRFGSGN